MTTHRFHFDLPGESWRETDVAGYYISDLGRLASSRLTGRGGIDINRIKLRKLKPGSGGYVRFGLAGDSRYIHRLVAAAFLPPPPSGVHEVEFLDDDLANCRADNLAWKTPQEKFGAQLADGTWDPASRGHGKKMTEGVVRSLRQDLAAGLRPSEAAVKYRVSTVTIHAIKTGRTWSHVQ